MSKLKKFIKTPRLFIKDMLLKKFGVNNSIQNKKFGVKESIKNKIFDSNNFNVFMNYNIILHTGEKENAISHIKIWIEYFFKSNVNFIILTRFQESFLQIKNEYPNTTIICAPNKKEIDLIFEQITSLKACFYPSNTGNNSHLLYQTKIKHIFIGHGDSDKSASAHKFFRVYDENWVAGQAHIDRFKNANFNLNGLKQVIVGRPSLYNYLKNNQKNWFERFNNKINLLYLPTWEGTFKEQDYSSLSILKENLINISQMEQINSSIKLHPFTGQREKIFSNLEQDLKNINRLNSIAKSETLNKYLENSNMFICDISAVVSECLALNGPIFLYMPKDKEIKISNSNMAYEEYCYIYSNTSELIKLIKEVIKGNDYLAENRLKAAEYIIGVKETLEKTFVKNLKFFGELKND